MPFLWNNLSIYSIVKLRGKNYEQDIYYTRNEGKRYMGW